jgi:non-ribosomal peptide synthase protein (TIGR01720 family)
LLGASNKTYHTEINDLLLTALGCALSKLTKESVSHIVLEGHGREEIDENLDITGTLGWFTTMYPVRLETGEEIEISIKLIKETLREVPNKGIGYGPLVGYKDRKLPRVSFNYLGQFEGEEIVSEDKTESQGHANDQAQAQNKQIWGIVGESSGVSMHRTNYDHNIININGIVIEGSLRFNIATKFDVKTGQIFANVFKESLEEIITHTSDQTRTYLTTSDVNKIISQEYLDKIQAKREIECVYKANSLQQGFIYHALAQGDVDDAYRVQLIFEYHHSVNINHLKEAWESSQTRYSSLRLRFAWDEELVQIIDKDGRLDWRYLDLSHEEQTTQDFKIGTRGRS